MDYVMNIIPQMLDGCLVSFQVFIITIVLSIPLGVLLSLGRVSGIKPLQALIGCYVWILRGTPLMLQLLIWYFGPFYLWGMNIGGYKYDKKTRTFPIFINYDKQDNISDTTKYEDHFVAENRLIAISKSGRSMDSEDVQNFLKATERGIDVQLFVRKNKDDKISKEFYYLGRMTATGRTEEFVMANTDKTAVEIEWALDTPVREDIYEYIVNS